MKKNLFFIFTLFILAGCGKRTEVTQKSVNAESDSGAVRIAIQPTMECLPLIVAKEYGLFERGGVNVSLKMFTSQIDCDTAVARHNADGMITDVVRAVFWEKENKRNLNYASWTNSHLMLISSKKSRIKDLSQMTDRIMAVTRYSFSDLLADSAMLRAGKSPEEMFKVQINDQNIRLNMLLENKMDAAFLQNPYAAEAVANGGQVLMHGGKSRSGLLAFDKTVGLNDINKVLDVYNDACDTINARGIMHFAPLVEKYMHKDITKWKKHIDDIKFRHSQNVEPGAIEKARKWIRTN